MIEQQVIEGTWEEIAQHAGDLAGSGKRLKLIIPADEMPGGGRVQARPAGRAYFGMFKGEGQSTDEEFKEAEFHGDSDDGLDWSE
jgi:hypothetical protein